MQSSANEIQSTGEASAGHYRQSLLGFQQSVAHGGEGMLYVL
jgi:hypothetical protein